MENVAQELPDYNLYTSDTALTESVNREGGSWGQAELEEFGRLTGTRACREWGHLANRYPPELETHDSFGHRINFVRYQDSYHHLMTSALENGIHSSP